MAVGTKIAPSGNQLSYAGASLGSGVTKGLLNIFTDTSGIAPSSGNTMNPRNMGTYSTDYGYYVNGGTYTGAYFMNRNNPVGATVWSNINSNGQYKLGDFYNYIHWPTDNRFVTVLDNNATPDDIVWSMRYGGFQVLNDTIPANTYYDPSSGAPYYIASAGGSGGAFATSAVSTDWNIGLNLYNLTQNQPTNVKIELIDYHTTEQLYFNIVMLDPGSSWTFSDNINFAYFRVGLWNIQCN